MPRIPKNTVGVGKPRFSASKHELCKSAQILATCCSIGKSHIDLSCSFLFNTPRSDIFFGEEVVVGISDIVLICPQEGWVLQSYFFVIFTCCSIGSIDIFFLEGRSTSGQTNYPCKIHGSTRYKIKSDAWIWRGAYSDPLPLTVLRGWSCFHPFTSLDI